MIIYLDTETTGLTPGQICQLSYVLQDDRKTVAKNYFFKVDYMPKEAFMVHGFSKEKLDELSYGKTFKDSIEEIDEDFITADLLIAHNFSFDSAFLREEFIRANKVFTYKNALCSMKNTVNVCKLIRAHGGYKYPKLNELCFHFGITDKEIEKTVSSLFNGGCGYHDARFDTSALYLAMNYAMEKERDFLDLKYFLK